uniref:Uncharacterized protein n=1 Tax=Nothobranchius furzeri TaxID=105023 RepID=A0A1A8B731_NOTFU
MVLNKKSPLSVLTTNTPQQREYASVLATQHLQKPQNSDKPVERRAASAQLMKTAPAVAAAEYSCGTQVSFKCVLGQVTQLLLIKLNGTLFLQFRLSGFKSILWKL